MKPEAMPGWQEEEKPMTTQNEALEALSQLETDVTTFLGRDRKFMFDKIRSFITAQGQGEKWKQLADFHFDAKSDLPEKANLYLTGISALGVIFMEETGATSFEISSNLSPKITTKKYKALFKITESVS